MDHSLGAALPQSASPPLDTPTDPAHGKAHENQVARATDASPVPALQQPASPPLDTPIDPAHGKAHENQVARATDASPVPALQQPAPPPLDTPIDPAHGKAHENQIAKAVDDSPVPALQQPAPPLLDTPIDPAHGKAHENQLMNTTGVITFTIADDTDLLPAGTSWLFEERGGGADKSRADGTITSNADSPAQGFKADGPKQPHVNKPQEFHDSYLVANAGGLVPTDDALALATSHDHEAIGLSRAPFHDWLL